MATIRRRALSLAWIALAYLLAGCGGINLPDGPITCETLKLKPITASGGPVYLSTFTVVPPKHERWCFSPKSTPDASAWNTSELIGLDGRVVRRNMALYSRADTVALVAQRLVLDAPVADLKRFVSKWMANGMATKAVLRNNETVNVIVNEKMPPSRFRIMEHSVLPADDGRDGCVRYRTDSEERLNPAPRLRNLVLRIHAVGVICRNRDKPDELADASISIRFVEGHRQTSEQAFQLLVQRDAEPLFASIHFY